MSGPGAETTMQFLYALRSRGVTDPRVLSAMEAVDRGPFVRGRIVDVSTGAAGVLGMKASGVAPVRVELVSR